MPDEIRANRGMPLGRSDSDMPMQHMGRGRGSKLPWIVLAVVVMVLVVLGIVFRDTLTGAGKTSGYQAVFLTNGQVYFGRMSHANGNYIKLSDIYYLQQVPDPALQGEGTQNQQGQSRLQLVKLGSELHGPEDVMSINRDQVLFYEDMKADAKVVQAILDYQKNPNQTAPAQTQSPGTQEVPVQQVPKSAVPSN